MANAIYLLCALTSLACAGLLMRSWRRSGVRLLLWCGLGFVALAGNNLLLLVDQVLLPTRDLHALRDLTGFIGVAVILFGLIWESG